jgi:hypothetical protein
VVNLRFGLNARAVARAQGLVVKETAGLRKYKGLFPKGGMREAFWFREVAVGKLFAEHELAANRSVV